MLFIGQTSPVAPGARFRRLSFQADLHMLGLSSAQTQAVGGILPKLGEDLANLTHFDDGLQASLGAETKRTELLLGGAQQLTLGISEVVVILVGRRCCWLVRWIRTPLGQ